MKKVFSKLLGVFVKGNKTFTITTADDINRLVNARVIVSLSASFVPTGKDGRSLFGQFIFSVAKNK